MRRSLLTAGVVLLLSATAAEAKLPATIGVNVPPGGSATLTSPTLPASAKQATVTVESPDDALFEKLRVALSSTKATFGRRVVACVILGTGVFYGQSGLVAVETEVQPLALLFISACIEVARSLPSDARARAAAAGCATAPRSVPVKITRSGGGYRMEINGRPRRPKARSPLITTCRRTANGMQIKVRPRKRGVTLRRVIGSKLSIGVQNTSRDDGGPVKTTFDAR